MRARFASILLVAAFPLAAQSPTRPFGTLNRQQQWLESG